MRTHRHCISGALSEDRDLLMDRSLYWMLRAFSTSPVPPITSSDRQMINVLEKLCIRLVMLHLRQQSVLSVIQLTAQVYDTNRMIRYDDKQRTI